MDREAGCAVTSPSSWHELMTFLGAVSVIGGFYLAYHIVRLAIEAGKAYKSVRDRFDD